MDEEITIKVTMNKHTLLKIMRCLKDREIEVYNELLNEIERSKN